MVPVWSTPAHQVRERVWPLERRVLVWLVGSGFAGSPLCCESDERCGAQRCR